MSHHPAYTLSAVCALGGIAGYTRTKSKPSLIAGISLGLLYGLSGYLIQSNKEGGVQLAAVTSLLLTGAMGRRAIKTRKPVPMVLGSAGAVGLSYYGLKLYQEVNGV